MVGNRTLTVVVVLAVVVCFWGCGTMVSQPLVCTVVPCSPMPLVGSPAPDVTFVDRAGRPQCLSSVYGDATVIVFTGRASAEPSADVVALASTLGARVSVVEVCSCRDGRFPEAASARSRRAGRGRMVSLRDPEGRLRERYGFAGATGAFVVDCEGTICAEGGRDDLSLLGRKALDLAFEAERKQDAMYGG